MRVTFFPKLANTPLDGSWSVKLDLATSEVASTDTL